ncbi:hypothetical protein R3W88_031367 [Solanum pinnatisectum]|uniref:Uncharacterized protein n=1 Tax=Solanum pinnatisectum TaxID=50273 RepID=A0AAV9LNQ4_9SOLN|nr:hypothetical protein R3W88_031367 [Solanum pinnatisectum]
MAKCDFCSVYDPNLECLAESCPFVKYGIDDKVNKILLSALNSVNFQAVAVSVVPVDAAAAAAAPAGSRTSNGFKKNLKNTATFFKELADVSANVADAANQANFFPPPDMPSSCF